MTVSVRQKLSLTSMPTHWLRLGSECATEETAQLSSLSLPKSLCALSDIDLVQLCILTRFSHYAQHPPGAQINCLLDTGQSNYTQR